MRYLRWAATTSVIVGLLYLFVDMVSAQQVRCGPYEQVIRALSGKYGEHLYDSRESLRPGATYEIWLNTQTRTFTALSRSGKVACIISSGRVPKQSGTEL